MRDICVYFSLSVAYFKGKSDIGPPKKKKKCKKKHYKEKVTDGKTPTPKPQSKPLPTPAAQKGPAPAKQKGSTAKSVNAATAQTPKGVYSNSVMCLCHVD